MTRTPDLPEQQPGLLADAEVPDAEVLKAEVPELEEVAPVLAPSADYLERIAKDGLIRGQQKIHPRDLEFYYWQERTALWLAEHAQPTDITLRSLVEKWAADLEDVLETPPLSPMAQRLYTAYRMIQEPTARPQAIRDYDHLYETLSEPDKVAAERAVAVRFRHDWIATSWAWQREGLLLFNDVIYRPHVEPPRWLLRVVGLAPARERPHPDPTRRPPRGPRPLPFVLDQVTVLSAPAVQGATEAMWAIDSTGGQALFRQPNAPPSLTASNGVVVSVGGPATLTIDSKMEAALWEAALALDDDTAATFLICMAKWFADTDGRDPLGYSRVHVSEILAFRDFKQHAHGGYTPAQKQNVAHAVLALRDVWVKGTDVGYTGKGRQRKPITIYTDSPLMDVALGTEDLLGQVPYWFDVRPGIWARDYLTEDNWKTAVLLRRVLQYDARQGVERMAMRLGLYLTLQWRTRASHGTFHQSLRVETLLTRTRLVIPTDRRLYTRFRDQFEAAMDRLQDEGVVGTRDADGTLIDGWYYAKGDEANLPSYRWFPIWLQWTIIAPPPTSILDMYAHLSERHHNQTARLTRKPRLPKGQVGAPTQLPAP